MKQNKDTVIFYGAGVEAKYWAHVYEAKGIIPVCICDKDEKKWGTLQCGIPCISLEDGIKKYPTAKLVVTPRYPLRFHIMEELITSGIVEKEQILNYEPYQKMISCHFLHDFMDMHFTGEVQFCCKRMSRKTYPYVEFTGNVKDTVRESVKAKKEIIEKINEGKAQETPCGGCEGLCEDYWPVDTRFRHVAYSAGGGCQFNCAYCFTPARHHMIEETWEKEIPLQRLVEELEKADALHPDVKLEIGPGEITVIPKRNEIFDVLQNYQSIILTNAGVYSQEIEKLIDQKKTRLLVSVDAGTREGFRKVKGVDAFEMVERNLKKYASHGALIELKYIFMGGLNDNIADIEGFVNLAWEIGAKSVQISHDYRCGETDLQENLDLIDKMKTMKDLAQRKGLEVGVMSVFEGIDEFMKE